MKLNTEVTEQEEETVPTPEQIAIQDVLAEKYKATGIGEMIGALHKKCDEEGVALICATVSLVDAGDGKHAKVGSFAQCPGKNGTPPEFALASMLFNHGQE